jgi:antitoxin component YwqK of YwqJK toxin-antitoxin module
MGNTSKRVRLSKLTLKRVESENSFGRHIKHKRNGILNGQSYTLYPNGTLHSAGNYLEGEAEGLFMEWYESGEMKSVFNYSKGLGSVVDFWLEDGTQTAKNGTGYSVDIKGSADLYKTTWKDGLIVDCERI